MTFSIVARDPQNGDLGVAVASKFLAVGSVVSHAQAGVGAVATQALANYTYGASGLAALRSGLSAEEAIRQLTEADEGRDHRQLGIVDTNGGSASYTGTNCITWAGGRTDQGVAAQGNLLAGPEVIDALIETYLKGGLPLPELLLSSMQAADDAGGDRRGRQSCALLVVREAGGYGGNNDRLIDLRVDDSEAPIEGVGKLLALYHLYGDRPKVEDLMPIDETLAAELQRLLEAAGYTPATTSRDGGLASIVDSLGVERTGEPRATPESWDDAWQGSMSEWMSVENLEERMTARGWIDPRVLEHLRSTTR
jgi:uncharacterized Ntn-hydrolase superfamily protein